MNLEFLRRLHIGFSIAVGVTQLAPCYPFGDSGPIDERYHGYPKSEGFPNPWHIGTIDAENYPDPNHLVQGELEMLAWLFSTVVELKPKMVFESGTNIGLGARALAAGCWVNGFGHVVSYDTDERMVEYAMKLCKGLPVDVYHGPALEAKELSVADFAFIDSDERSRVEEITKLKSGAVYVLHDTHGEMWMRRHTSADDHVHIDGPRGFTIGRKP